MKLLLVSHGNLAYEISQSAKMIIGDLRDVETIGLQLNESIAELESRIISVLEEAKNHGKEVFVVSDLFFGTPFNVLATLSRKYTFYHITGFNLPILLEIINNKERLDGAALRKYIMDQAKETIIDVNEFLEKNEE